MQKDLADIITEVSGAGATGILTLSMSSDPALFKIFFKNGKVYHITHGTCKDRECLATMADRQFTQGSFLSGAHVDMKDVNIIPHDDIMVAVRNANKMITWTGRGDAASGQGGKADAQHASVDPAVIGRIGDELLNMVGPIAPMVLSNAYETCALKQGSTITKLDFQRLLIKISDQLPEEHKKTFIKQFAWQSGG
jgi:hypothetical protein